MIHSDPDSDDSDERHGELGTESAKFWITPIKSIPLKELAKAVPTKYQPETANQGKETEEFLKIGDPVSEPLNPEGWPNNLKDALKIVLQSVPDLSEVNTMLEQTIMDRHEIHTPGSSWMGIRQVLPEDFLAMLRWSILQDKQPSSSTMEGHEAGPSVRDESVQPSSGSSSNMIQQSQLPPDHHARQTLGKHRVTAPESPSATKLPKMASATDDAITSQSEPHRAGSVKQKTAKTLAQGPDSTRDMKRAKQYARKTSSNIRQS